MKIIIKAGYTHNRVGVWHKEIQEKMLPLDVAPSMVCHHLNSVPKEGEVIYLGKSRAHHYPSDVMVKLATEKQVYMLDWIEKSDIVDVAKFVEEEDLSEENLFKHRSEIECDADFKVWDMSDDEIDEFLEKNLDSVKTQLAQELLKIMTPSEIEDFASSDYIWGKGKLNFFTDAYRRLDQGEATKIPDEWSTCSEAYRYGAFKDLFEEE